MSRKISRRRFAVQSAAAAAALAGVELLPAMAQVPQAKWVDAHVHCFAGPANDRFPYHPHAPYRPDEISSPEQLLRCMDEANVDYAVIVHPEPYQDDHRYLEHCLEIGHKRLKGTVLLFGNRPGSLEQLPGLVRRHPIVALRVHAYAPERLPAFGKPDLRRIWSAATDSGIAIQLHLEPRYAPHFEPLIREFHKTTVIIDHMGRPLQGTPEEHAIIVAWSRFPNTVMKLSALPDTRMYPHRDITPIVTNLTAEFGSERMIYGGGFSSAADGASYAAAFKRARGYLAHLSSAEQQLVLGGNAVRLFGFAS